MDCKDQMFSEAYDSLKGGVTHKSIIKGIHAILSKEYKNDDSDLTPYDLGKVVSDIAITSGTTDAKINYFMLKKLLFWQCCFYNIGKQVDSDVKNKYLDLYGNYVEVYNLLIKNVDDMSALAEFQLNVDFKKPLNRCVKDLAKVAEVIAGVFYKVIEDALCDSGERGILPFWVFHKEVIGNEAKWNKRFEEWLKSYYVYDKIYNDHMTKTAVVNLMADNHLVFPNSKDSSSSIHKLDRYLDGAQKLVLSAQRGTFPITPAA